MCDEVKECTSCTECAMCNNDAPVPSEPVVESVEKKTQKAPKEPRAPKAPKRESMLAKQAIRSGQVTFQCEKTRETFCDWYDAIMDAAEIVDRRYPVKGMPVFRPYGYYMHSAIMRSCEDIWEEQGIHRCLFPTTIPETFLNKEGEHIKGFSKECFWCEKAGEDVLDVRLALRPTSETAFYSMYSLWIRTYRDLPMKMNQTTTVFRYETKSTRPLIRVREIPWNEAHTCHATKEDALQQMKDYWKGYLTIFEDLLGFTGKKLRRAPWDKFAGSEHTEVMDTIMPCGRVLQTAGIHYLGQKFSRVFDIKFSDVDNTQKYCEMTCAGISTRVLASALAIHGDSEGLILPPHIAQYQVVILPVGPKNKRQEMIAACKKLASDISALSVVDGQIASRIRVTVDESPNTLGEMIYQWSMKGVPIRIELGPRDLENNSCVLVARDLGKDGKKVVPLDGIAATIRTELAEFLARIKAKSFKDYEDRVTYCRNLDEVVEAITKKGGFAKVPFYGVDNEAKQYDDLVRCKCGAEIRGYWPEEIPAEDEVCFITGKKATVYAYIARTY